MPEPPENRVRRLSYSALALFELCSYRFYAERIVGLRETKPARGDGETARERSRRPRSATRCTCSSKGSTSRPPRRPTISPSPSAPATRSRRTRRSRGFGGLVEDYCRSDIAQRLAGLEGATVERSFAFEHDGVLLHGRLDVFHEADGHALVVDYKTNVLEDASPAEVVEREYGLQRLVYALACLRPARPKSRSSTSSSSARTTW